MKDKPVIFAVTPRVFVTVIPNGQLRIPTSRLPKLMVEGTTLIEIGPAPAPVWLNVTISGESPALLVTTNEAVAEPLTVGADVTQMVQDPPGATDAPQEFACVKLPETAPQCLRSPGAPRPCLRGLPADHCPALLSQSQSSACSYLMRPTRSRLLLPIGG